MLVQQNRVPDNLTITLFDEEGDRFLEVIDAIVDPAENEPTADSWALLKQLWLKLHSARSH
ncbi:MAG: hypothetical protein A3I01_17985 [Betaproteobacteria bacterium RIFCSPLOWO2_02_FULL_65_24]|nr:MAG: hypothetical protein A3I01_17985 [Betaproteobacteria bacterium RIFCSPLOWO2_02_FULL_65_24]OGA81941.1 MAG: hypothetical protein A3G27_16830 [Betaproteobacteria bacterium RIFCSPLOWO2_12_FULL_66_14]